MRFDLYKGSRGDRRRYVLGKTGRKTICVVGVNPSTANRVRSDVTATKVERFAARHGFDGFVLLNLYPVRSTSPADLPEVPDPGAVLANERSIREAAGRVRPVLFWAAWGDAIDTRVYLRDCLLRIRSIKSLADGRWVRAGSPTARQNPRHPSRMGYSAQFVPFDVDSYLRGIISVTAN